MTHQIQEFDGMLAVDPRSRVFVVRIARPVTTVR
jgi:hypothetical protein